MVERDLSVVVSDQGRRRIGVPWRRTRRLAIPKILRAELHVASAAIRQPEGLRTYAWSNPPWRVSDELKDHAAEACRRKLADSKSGQFVVEELGEK